MSKPKAYSPEMGYRYQILCRNSHEWEHCDYATDKQDKNHLLDNYRQCYAGFEFKVITLPMKYWPTWQVFDGLNSKLLLSTKRKDYAERYAKKEIADRHLLPTAIIVQMVEPGHIVTEKVNL